MFPPDKRPIPQIFQRLTDFILCIHDERAVPGDGFAEWFSRDQEETDRPVLRRDIHGVAVRENDQMGTVDWVSFGSE